MPTISLDTAPYTLSDGAALLGSRLSYSLKDAQGKVVVQIGEQKAHWTTHLLRYTDWDNASPFRMVIESPEGEKWGILQKKRLGKKRSIQLLSPEGDTLARVTPRRFRKQGALLLLDPDEAEIGNVSTKISRKTFTLSGPGIPQGRISKRWAGIVSESLSHQDRWQIEMESPCNPEQSLFVLALCLAIDRALR